MTPYDLFIKGVDDGSSGKSKDPNLMKNKEYVEGYSTGIICYGLIK